MFYIVKAHRCKRQALVKVHIEAVHVLVGCRETTQLVVKSALCGKLNGTRRENEQCDGMINQDNNTTAIAVI